MEENMSMLELRIEDIQPNPFQPRRYFDPTQLQELAESIKEYGVMQPVLVRIVDGQYQLISGERRFRASKLAGKETVPAIIAQLGDKEVAEMALIENLQREDLSYFEEAEGYARLIEDFQITQEEVAKKMGKSQPTIANKLRLLQISERVRREISVDVITERHARALLKLKDEEMQLEALHKIYQFNYNVKQTESLVENLLEAHAKETKARKMRKTMQSIRDFRIFSNTIKSTVQTIRDTGVEAQMEERETEEYMEYVIRLPKNEMKSE